MDDNTELEMLREFYKNWVGLHIINRNDRDAMELAAQRLVDSAHTIEAFKSGAQVQ